MMEGIVAILSIFVVLPGIIFTYAYKNRKNKMELKKIEYRKEILQMEMEKDDRKIKLLEEENKKLDKIINEN
jgi:cell shape-determining protein MreC